MHVYILQRPDGLIKIGFSTDPTKRLRSLETQGGFDAASAWVSVPVENAKAVEAKAHEKLAEHRVIGEWFKADFDDAIQTVIDALSAKPFNVQCAKWNERAKLVASERGLTIAKIAEIMEVTPGCVGHWMSGRRMASIEEIQLIASILGVSPAWLAFGHGPIEQESLHAADILAPLTPAQRAQALRMLEAFAASCAQEDTE